jgi:hypothetical protein
MAVFPDHDFRTGATVPPHRPAATKRSTGQAGVDVGGQVASWYDPRIVAELAAAHAGATFFLTGLWAQTYPDVIRALAANPADELENHSFDHAAWEPPCYGLRMVSGEGAKTAEVLDAARVIDTEAAIEPIFFRRTTRLSWPSPSSSVIAGPPSKAGLRSELLSCATR